MKIKRSFSNEEIIILLKELGSEEYHSGSNGELIFRTVCHNHNTDGSYKLYFYPDTQLFHCYTDCGDSFNTYELVARRFDWSLPQDFGKCVQYVYKVLNISNIKNKGFIQVNTQSDDWDVFDKYILSKQTKSTATILPYSHTLIDFYPKHYTNEWLSEGISTQTMDKYNIRFDPINNKIVIPHYNASGQLIGIRGRALNQQDIDMGQKYMPLSIEDTIFKYPTAYNLYGLNFNLEAIQRTKKIMIFEAEKSVLKCEDFYGENNFSVACSGSNISNFQRDLICSLGVREVFIALDKEYKKAFTDESDEYSEKIHNLCYKFTPYVTTYVLWDTDNLLEYKDAPCDKGQAVLEQLMKKKFEVLTQEEID